MTSLLQRIATERGPIRLGELLGDIRAKRGDPDFPKSPGELRAQLDALVKAGLVRCFEAEQVEWVEIRPVAPEPERTLF